MPTPHTVTVWHPLHRVADPADATDLTIHLVGAPHHSQLWCVVSTPSNALLFNVLAARLSAHLTLGADHLQGSPTGRHALVVRPPQITHRPGGR
ncbi:hypothetical protein [Deinococcus rufus]|uniref:Uncharacterized protein n=1 Tax=Deinococcus rufus TaxID=2136097 RepID=A0ABV7Z9X6_9DEIO